VFKVIEEELPELKKNIQKISELDEKRGFFQHDD
jgi:hypothetical protein